MSGAGFRNLDNLRIAGSTSRVLNLLRLNQQHANDSEHLAKPLFHSPALRTALVVKHRLRADETFVFSRSRRSATKLILPLDATDLKLGGRSFFVRQKGYNELCSEALISDPDLRAYDMKVLSLIDEIPSLDPFLMREHLRRNQVDVAQSYFEIAPSDLTRMSGYVGREIKKLIDLAFAGAPGATAYADKMVDALLANDITERLDPLRMTLRLEGENYKEGMFSWKGFLYYKWMISELSLNLRRVVKEMSELRVIGPRDPETSVYLFQSRDRITKRLSRETAAVRLALKVYDDAYRDLTDHSRPLAFREFLLKAPHMFLSLGEKVGAISHIVSFWQFRFPPGKNIELSVADALDLFADFDSNLMDDPEADAA